jgi:catechol 2,3-dioxygenase-like lactoylglutathione lyase family enzyme
LQSTEPTETSPVPFICSHIPPWSRAYQIGVVVADLDAARLFYESIGIGPFMEGPSAHTRLRRIRGVDAPDVEVRGLLAKLGALEFEILQPVAGQGIQQEFLTNRGEGALHVCAYTENIDRDIAWMNERGIAVISEGFLTDGGHFAYFDTAGIGGVVLELYQLGPDGEIIPETTTSN